MAKKGSKFARRIYTKDENSIKKLCKFLEKYDPDTVVVLDDIYEFYGDYYVIGFRATKDELIALISSTKVETTEDEEADREEPPVLIAVDPE